MLARAPTVLQLLEEYKGCQDLARKAMSTPTLANETEAFEGLLDSVKSIATFFTFSKQIEEVVPDLLMSLSRGPTEENKQVGPPSHSAHALSSAIAMTRAALTDWFYVWCGWLCCAVVQRPAGLGEAVR